jgi:hypothetical protein
MYCSPFEVPREEQDGQGAITRAQTAAIERAKKTFKKGEEKGVDQPPPEEAVQEEPAAVQVPEEAVEEEPAAVQEHEPGNIFTVPEAVHPPHPDFKIETKRIKHARANQYNSEEHLFSVSETPTMTILVLYIIGK